MPGADDQSIRIPLPGDFWFYGQMFDSINACSNGYLSFISQEAVAYPSPFPDTLPPDGTPDGTIAPFWADRVTTGGYCHYYYDSTAGLFIMEWDSVIRFGTDVRYSFRAVLDFNDSSRAFVYHLADSGWLYDLTAINGIESGDACQGLPWKGV